MAKRKKMTAGRDRAQNMAWKNEWVEVLVPRTEIFDEVTFAVVRVLKTAEVRHPEDVFPRLRAAVTEWVGTEAGQLAYSNSGFDYNVGDLASDLGDLQLLVCLERHGLLGVVVDYYTSAQVHREWKYDTHLCVKYPDGQEEKADR